MTAMPSGDDPRPDECTPPPWRRGLIDMVIVAALALSIFSGFIFLGLWARSLHRQVAAQVGRIEAKVDYLHRFVRGIEAGEAGRDAGPASESGHETP